MEKGCIIVSTPLQVLSACVIAEQYNQYDFDMIIIGNFSSYMDVQEKLRETNIFSNVLSYELKDIRLFHGDNNKLLKILGTFHSYIHYKKTGNIILGDICDYKIVFYAAAFSAMELLFYLNKKLSPLFVMFDDGVMTYRNIDHCLGNEGILGKLKKVYERANGKISPSILVYLPDLFISMNGNSYDVIRLNSMSHDVVSIAKKIYNAENVLPIEDKYIVLECKVDDYLKDDEISDIEEIYAVLDNNHPQDVIYKRHPRDKREQFPGRHYLEGQIPYEVYNMIQNMSDKIIIAWDSTAVLTPKLFFGEEPKVILMYKIYQGKNEKLNPETDKLYRKFRESYSNPDKFLIPNTKEELIEILS